MYSSTTLNAPAKSGCWKQVDYAEANADSLFPLEYRSFIGQAAHAVLQICAERKTDTEEAIRKTGEDVGNVLISKGRDFRGHAEPPMPADDVRLGVDLAVTYAIARGLPVDAEAVIPERDWNHPSLPYQALIDLVTVQDEGDEEYGVRVAEVTDYKSSWQAGEDELDTLQRWGQAVCVWRAQQEHTELWDTQIDIIRQSVINLRTWTKYTRDIRLDDPEDVAELEKWEKRIESLCNKASESPRPANPGVGCLSCAYRHICEDCTHLDQGATWSASAAAHDLALVEAQRSMIILAIKACDAEKPIAVPGGWVGYQQKTKRVFKPGKELEILSEWLSRTGCAIPEEDMPVLVSLISALKLGKGNLDALARALMPERVKGIGQVRDDYVESLTTEKRYGAFGVWEDE